ncbi:hypothetical protein Gotur_004937 [Gossypium turneri]
MEQILLLYAILTEKSINGQKIILKEIHDCAKKKATSEQEEPTEPDTEESTDGTETEANSVTKSDKEPNIPEPKFPDATFETWTEDTDDASGDGAKEDKGNKSEK